MECLHGTVLPEFDFLVGEYAQTVEFLAKKFSRKNALAPREVPFRPERSSDNQTVDQSSSHTLFFLTHSQRGFIALAYGQGICSKEDGSHTRGLLGSPYQRDTAVFSHHSVPQIYRSLKEAYSDSGWMA